MIDTLARVTFTTLRLLPTTAAVLACAGTASAQTPAAPSFAQVFTDHAVLQRNRPLTVWGRAAPSEQVTVSFAGQTAEARADRQGRWRASLPALPAGGPHDLSVRAVSGTATVRDVKVGDVYLCAGQSNMEFPVRFATDAWGGFPDSADDDLRFLTIPHRSEPAPLDDLDPETRWQVVSPETVGDASAVCYFMARSLRATAKAPIGMIHSSWGGTTIQSWISLASLKGVRRYVEGVRTVSLLATDPAAARVREERRQEAWWTARGLTANAERAWMTSGFDDASWPALAELGAWKRSGRPDLADFDGVVWFRSVVTLSDADRAAGARLKLGPIDAADSVWVNGRWIGSGAISWYWRDYEVPADVLRPGRNVIAIRVLGGEQGGGLFGHPDRRGIVTADGRFVPLNGPWRYHVGVRARGVAAPASPWSVPASLTTLYNGMIAPLKGYGFKLAAWYQGEANVGEPEEYRTLLPLMMADWRRELGQPDLPFLVAQLTAFGSVAAKPGRSDWAALRQAQADVVAADRHAGLAVTIDVGDRNDIHPTQKAVVGARLARAARAAAYGEAVTSGGPEAVGVTRRDADLVVAFRNTNGGLRTYSADVAIGFEVCRRAPDDCTYAVGAVRGDEVVLTGANRPDVMRVRYAWADSPYVNLYGSGDLPAAPFTLAVSNQAVRGAAAR